jgi:superfamily II DNA or RNA helicase
MILRFYLENLEGNFLLIVPNISLVEQMFNDFREYSQINGFDVEEHCAKVYSGKDKNTGKRITISTWQSMFKMPKDYLEQFTLLIGDECHTQKSKETSGLIENLINCSHRYGFTGTLDNEKIHELVITGLFGDIQRISKSSELIKDGKLSKLMINCITFNYSEEESRLVCKNDWEHEVQFINSHEARNDFIVNLAHSLKGNALIVFSRVEKHGMVIFNKLQERTSKNCYFIYGKVKASEREDIRQAVEGSENNIIVATSQIFAQGINIKSLQHVILAHPSKGRIRLIQTIGRALRKSDRKDVSYIHDLSDNLCSKNKKNYSFKHFKERLRMYVEEEFPYRTFEHRLF